MKHLKMLLLLSGLLIFAGCSRNDKEARLKSEVDEIPLNNGEKWKADTATVHLVEKLRSKVNEFHDQDLGSYTVLDYRSLGIDLQLLLTKYMAEGRLSDDPSDGEHKYINAVNRQVRLMRTSDLVPAKHAEEILARTLEDFPDYFKY